MLLLLANVSVVWVLLLWSDSLVLVLLSVLSLLLLDRLTTVCNWYLRLWG